MVLPLLHAKESIFILEVEGASIESRFNPIFQVTIFRSKINTYRIGIELRSILGSKFSLRYNTAQGVRLDSETEIVTYTIQSLEEVSTVSCIVSIYL